MHTEILIKKIKNKRDIFNLLLFVLVNKPMTKVMYIGNVVIIIIKLWKSE